MEKRIMTSPKLQGRELHMKILRGFASAYDIGSENGQALRAALTALAALAPPSGEGVEIDWPFTYVMSHSGREFVPKDHAERKIRESIATPQSAPVDGIDAGAIAGEEQPDSWDAVDAALLCWYGHKLTFSQSERRRFFDAIQKYMVLTTPPPASQERGDGSIVLDAHQLRHAAEFAAPDYDQDEDQRGTELVFQSLPERVIDGETLPAGMYCWYAELPEEGFLYLAEYEEFSLSQAFVTKATQTGADDVSVIGADLSPVPAASPPSSAAKGKEVHELIAGYEADPVRAEHLAAARKRAAEQATPVSIQQMFDAEQAKPDVREPNMTTVERRDMLLKTTPPTVPLIDHGIPSIGPSEQAQAGEFNRLAGELEMFASCGTELTADDARLCAALIRRLAGGVAVDLVEAAKYARAMIDNEIHGEPGDNLVSAYDRLTAALGAK